MVRVTLALGLFLLACSSDAEHDSFEKLTKEAQPQFDTIAPIAREVLRLEGISTIIDDKVIEACGRPSAALEALRALDFNAPKLRAPRGYSVSDRADFLLSKQELYCERMKDPRECAQFCVRGWTELALAIEHFRGDAASHGVTVRALFY